LICYEQYFIKFKLPFFIIKTRKNAIVEYLDYQIPVTQREMESEYEQLPWPLKLTYTYSPHYPISPTKYTYNLASFVYTSHAKPKKKRTAKCTGSKNLVYLAPVVGL